MSLTNKAVELGITIAVVLVIISSVVLNLLDSANSFNSCTSAGSLVACSDCNNTDTSSTGYETFIETCHRLVGSQNNTHCYACANWGFRTISRGLTTLLIVIAFVGIFALISRFRQ